MSYIIGVIRRVLAASGRLTVVLRAGLLAGVVLAAVLFPVAAIRPGTGELLRDVPLLDWCAELLRGVLGDPPGAGASDRPTAATTGRPAAGHARRA